MSLAERIVPRPTRTVAEARDRFGAMKALDGPSISVPGRSRLIATDERVKTAVVLIHGFTNCPQQWMTFVPQLENDGYAIVVPRLPGHGFADRTSRTIGRVSTEQLLTTASDAVDIATGLADRVVVAGLSIGGSIGIWLALHRRDIATVVSIVPFFGLKPLDAWGNAVAAAVLTTLPDFFIPWDPSGKNETIPPYGYTHFPTRVLGECLHVGIDCYDEARRAVPTGNVHFLLNAKEPAVNNGMALEVARRFDCDRTGSTRTVVLENLPENHDIIDPTNPKQRTAIVYPRVRELIET